MKLETNNIKVKQEMWKIPSRRGKKTTTKVSKKGNKKQKY